MSDRIPIPVIDFNPKVYHCRRTAEKLVLDGNLEKPFWQNAAWTEDFVDIEGDSRPLPRYRTRAKMLWDDEALYIGAELYGDEIWAHVKERDAVIFHDNDFEVFIDPDSDTHCYLEFEMNALGTMWDLLLTKPYRDGGKPIDSFDIKGLKCAVQIDGELNSPKAANKKWSLEMMMPFKSLMECGNKKETFPVPGDYWRINFSRVQWRVTKDGDEYLKCSDPITGKPYPEDNWVWSPMGVINMHYPELWGFLFFCADEKSAFTIPESEKRKWQLRQYYYLQKKSLDECGKYSSDIAFANIRAQVLDHWFIASCPRVGGGIITIAADGKITESEETLL